MEIQLLADNEKVQPTVANWYFQEWGHLKEGNTLVKVTEALRGYLNKGKIPLMVLALEADQVLGTAQLKYREMDSYPEKEHWLGGVYVSKNYRGNEVAEKIIFKLISIAKQLDVHKLYLQTERLDGGLYSRLGWKPVEKVYYRGLNVLVMEKALS